MRAGAGAAGAGLEVEATGGAGASSRGRFAGGSGDRSGLSSCENRHGERSQSRSGQRNDFSRPSVGNMARLSAESAWPVDAARSPESRCDRAVHSAAVRSSAAHLLKAATPTARARAVAEQARSTSRASDRARCSMRVPARLRRCPNVRRSAASCPGARDGTRVVVDSRVELLQLESTLRDRPPTQLARGATTRPTSRTRTCRRLAACLWASLSRCVQLGPERRSCWVRAIKRARLENRCQPQLCACAHCTCLVSSRCQALETCERSRGLTPRQTSPARSR